MVIPPVKKINIFRNKKPVGKVDKTDFSRAREKIHRYFKKAAVKNPQKTLKRKELPERGNLKKNEN